MPFTDIRFSILSENMLSSELKKEFGMQVQSPEFCCFKYHLLESTLHLINSANYNKHFINKTNSLFSL